MRPHRAILLVGPTGAGKTPLGEMLQQRGLAGSRCIHFDFGASLRRIVERDRPGEHVGRDDVEFLRRVLQTGALLEDDHFPIAERVLRTFLDERGADEQTVVVLNGLPRHAGQAAAIEPFLAVEMVAVLDCPAEVVADRIRRDAGGDRAGRPDDDLALVRRKLAIYAERTAPLIAHYRARGVRIETLPVAATTTAEEAWSAIDRRIPR